MAIRIERLHPRPGCTKEEPARTAQGYQLVQPPYAGLKNRVEDAVFVDTLEEVADLVERRGCYVRMGCKGKRPSLISPRSLRITRC
jgi:hypothetical protein